MCSCGQDVFKEVSETHDYHLEAKKLTYKWILTSSSLATATYRCLFSPEFRTQSDVKPTWRISLTSPHPTCKYFSMCLSMNASPTTQVRGQFKLSLLNDQGEEVKTKSKPTFNFEKCIPVGFKKFAKKKFFYSLARHHLTVLCEVKYTINQFDFAIPKHVVQSKVIQNELQQDFQSLLDNEKFADVILSVDGVQFRAHKAILAARSDVFAAMFEHQMLERTTNHVEITDIRPEVFKEVLNFMYNGSIRNVQEMAIDVMAAADKYNLLTLKHVCEEKLCDNLSAETLVETLVAAELHNCEGLKAQAINFIHSNAAAVTKTQNWNYLQKFYPHLAMEPNQATKTSVSKKFKNIEG